MRDRIRRRLTYANVVATLALFLVVSGGTALGVTYVVTSNSQVGPGTISGHKPPTGKHANIITGSVNGTDLAAGSVSASKLGANSVNSSKVTNGSLHGADIGSNTIMGSNLNLTDVSSKLQIQQARSSDSPGDAPDTFYSHGAFTLTGTCVDEGSGLFHARIDLSSGSLPAWASIDNASGDRFTGTESTPVAQTVSALSGVAAVQGGEFSAATVDFTNHLSGHVLAVADGGTPMSPGSTCSFTFEGLGS
jgi:hypothetical protein